MKLIDTHCHIYLEDFDKDLESVIQEARKSNIAAFLLPNVDATTTSRLFDVCDRYPETAFPMMGLHPTSVQSDYVAHLNRIEALLSKRPYCAIGEIGLDLYWDKTYIKQQQIVFEEQLRWSIDLQLPVAIHTRDAWPEVLESLHKVGTDKLSGVFHSFSGDEEILKEVIKLNKFKLGINGVVTFKNSKLADVLQNTTLEHLLVETDAPYLSPMPFRGKRNEPSYMINTAKKLAEIYDVNLDKVAKTTTENAMKLFRNINKTI